MKRNIFRLMDFLPNKKVLKNMGFLVAGEAISKILMFFITIYLARVLAPDFYGRYSLAFNFTTGFMFLVTLGMDTIILRNGSKDKSSLSDAIGKVFVFRIVLGLLVALGLCIVTWLWLPYDANQKFVIYLASLLIITQSIMNLLNLVFRAFEHMHYNSLIRVLDVMLFGVVVWLLFISHKSPSAVIMAWIIAQIAIIILQLYLVKRFITYTINLKLDLKYCFSILKYSFWLGIASFIASFYGKVNIFIISLFLSTSSIAFYSVALQLVTAGTVIRSVISDAIFPNTCKNIYDKGYAQRLLRYISILTLLSGVVALAISLLAKPVILLAFGEEYLPAVPVLQVLIWYVPIFIYNIWGFQILDSTNNQKYHVLNEAIILTFTVILNILLIQKWGIIGAAASSVMARFAGSIYLNFLARKIIKRLGV